VVLGVFAAAMYLGESETRVRALTFTTLIIANLALILTNRSWTRTILNMWRFPNRAMWWVVLGAAAFLSVALYVPPVQSLFRFSMLHPTDVMLCLSAGVFSIIWFEILKMIKLRKVRMERAGCVRWERPEHYTSKEIEWDAACQNFKWLRFGLLNDCR
jgi:Ca2+-transporting ATPase